MLQTHLQAGGEQWTRETGGGANLQHMQATRSVLVQRLARCEAVVVV
jgi:hypothetical protein